MNWTVENIENQPYIKVVTGGDFSIDEQLKMIEDITSRDFWRPGTDVLFDHRKLDFGVTDINLIRKASDNHIRNDAKIGNGKAAILMKSLPDFARGRQFELLTESKVSAKLRIFKDEDEAIKWLLA
ncbi:MAG: hypothetical protein ABWZ66_05700 [Pyrinomonadaceae bacterium]